MIHFSLLKLIPIKNYTIPILVSMNFMSRMKGSFPPPLQFPLNLKSSQK